MLPKYVGKLFTAESIQKINKSIGYFLIISIDYSCNNFLMIYNGCVILLFSRLKELKVYFLIDGESIKKCNPLPFVQHSKMNKVTEL